MEFSFVLPIVLVVLVGVFEVGQLVVARQIVDNAAREAARLASVGVLAPSGPAPSIAASVDLYLREAGLNAAGMSVTVRNAGGTPVDPRNLSWMEGFSVEVEVPYDRNGDRGNRLIEPPMKPIAIPTVRSRVDWRSLKDRDLNLSAHMIAPWE